MNYFLISTVVLMLFYTPDQKLVMQPRHSKVNGLDTRNLLLVETFEEEKPFSQVHNIETGYWNYALQYVSQPVYKGKKAVRFEIRHDQPLVQNGKRAEVTVIKGLPGNDMWYSFAVYFPSDGFARDSQREVINQWYQDGSPATSLRVRHDRLFLETGSKMENRMQIDIGELVKDEWHEFVFHFIHSHNSEGLIELWHNGKKVITHKGGNMYDDVLPKWKIGVYKAAFKFGTSEVKRRVIFFDNIKVGGGKASYEEMIPGNN